MRNQFERIVRMRVHKYLTTYTCLLEQFKVEVHSSTPHIFIYMRIGFSSTKPFYLFCCDCCFYCLTFVSSRLLMVESGLCVWFTITLAQSKEHAHQLQHAPKTVVPPMQFTEPVIFVKTKKKYHSHWGREEIHKVQIHMLNSLATLKGPLIFMIIWVDANSAINKQQFYFYSRNIDGTKYISSLNTLIIPEWPNAKWHTSCPFEIAINNTSHHLYISTRVMDHFPFKNVKSDYMQNNETLRNLNDFKISQVLLLNCIVFTDETNETYKLV